jgi:predicted transcriptional regulator
LILEEENLVKKTCKELGITQKELAEITKIDRGNLSRWNLNKRKIVTSFIEKNCFNGKFIEKSHMAHYLPLFCQKFRTT